MLKDDLKCVLIGQNIEIYKDLAKLVKKIDKTSRFKQVGIVPSEIKTTLRKIIGPSLIFISDEISFSLELLSDLTWQCNPDAIVVIISEKARTIALKEPFNTTQFSRIKFDHNNSETILMLQFLIQSARKKSEFRHCKSLLGVSEKRCQWLVDSSREAVAFISRDMHWFANASYLSLFGIMSVKELRSITVKDFIVDSEHLLFDDFHKNQNKANDCKRSIMLSMKKLNGSTFRANAYLIPSVFKGKKCYQLWIREVNLLSTSETSQQTDDVQSDSSETNSSVYSSPIVDDTHPFSHLSDKSADSNASEKVISDSKKEQLSGDDETFLKVARPKTYNEHTLLKGVIRRKEARLVTQALSYLKTDEFNKTKVMKHQMLSLKVSAAQKKEVNDLLARLPKRFNDETCSVFWNKVKFTRLLQTLIQRKHVSVNLLLRIDEASIIDEKFIDWLLPGLERITDKSQNLILLIPSNINESELKKTLVFIRKLQKLKCKIALDSFSFDKSSLVLLKYAKPDYVRLSLPWTRQLQGNDTKEVRLSSAIRKLERSNIKVIAPCGFSKDMRRLFVLSGASFCQKTYNTV